jgi:hypothetical protein
VGAHVGLAAQHQDAAQDGVGVRGFFFHLVADALEEAREALVLVLARVDEVLVARGQLAAQQVLEAVDDFGMALHVVVLVWIAKPGVSGALHAGSMRAVNSRAFALWMQALSRRILIRDCHGPAAQCPPC